MRNHGHVTNVQARSTEIRRAMPEVGEKVLLLVEAFVSENDHQRRTSDGDIVVRTLKALDLHELDATDPAVVTILGEVRTQRRREDEERNGQAPIPGIDDDPIYLIAFDCGHETFYPEAWMAREESEDEVEATFWRDQERPERESVVAACPKCEGPRGELRTVTKLGLVGPQTAAEPEPKAEEKPEKPALTGGLPDLDGLTPDELAEVEPCAGYNAAGIPAIKEWLNGISDREQLLERARHTAFYEAEHKARKRLLDWLDAAILDPELEEV